MTTPAKTPANPHRRPPAGSRGRSCPRGATAGKPAPRRQPPKLSLVQLAALFVGAVGLIAALDLTLRSSGYLQLVDWLPKPVARWADSHGQLRNLPAFFLLALPFIAFFPRRKHRLMTAGGLLVLAALLEFAQYLRPQRWVEWQDVAWSWCGIALASVFFEVTRAVAKRVLSTRPARRLRAAFFPQPALASRRLSS